MMEDNKVLKEIEAIKTKLGYMEDTDFAYMDDALKELRHYVMYAHTSIENAMSIRIGLYLTNDIPSIQTDNKQRYGFFWKLGFVLSEMDFSKKLKVLRKQDNLPKDVHSAIMKVNDIRVYFSHPSAYAAQLRVYQENDDERLKAYKIVEEAVNILNGKNDRHK